MLSERVCTQTLTKYVLVRRLIHTRSEDTKIAFLEIADSKRTKR